MGTQTRDLSVYWTMDAPTSWATPVRAITTDLNMGQFYYTDLLPQSLLWVHIQLSKHLPSICPQILQNKLALRKIHSLNKLLGAHSLSGPVKGIGLIAVNRNSRNFSLVSIRSDAWIQLIVFLTFCVHFIASSFHQFTLTLLIPWVLRMMPLNACHQQSLTYFPCIGQLQIFFSWEILHVSLTLYFYGFFSPIICFIWTLTSISTLPTFRTLDSVSVNHGQLRSENTTRKVSEINSL